MGLNGMPDPGFDNDTETFSPVFPAGLHEGRHDPGRFPGGGDQPVIAGCGRHHESLGVVERAPHAARGLQDHHVTLDEAHDMRRVVRRDLDARAELEAVDIVKHRGVCRQVHDLPVRTLPERARPGNEQDQGG